MIAHKFPGIQLDLTSVEVIWLHFTRFFMDLEANFDSSMHVFKEPTGVYYKLTGNYSPKILEEAKQKTINYVQKNKIEMLQSELEYKHYMNICQELRQQFPKIYIQLLHYNVFDYVGRRLHQKFGYKQALQDYQELIKKKKRFCYLICDKAYFPQIKEIFYQLADPIEKQTSGTSSSSLRRTTSTTTAPSPTLQQQIQQNTTTQHNRSSSTAVVHTNNPLNAPINISNQDEINIHNFEEPPSPCLAMEMKSNSMYEEDDYNQYNLYVNQANILSAEGGENYKGLEIQKEDFPCLSEAQILLNQQQQLLNDSSTSNSNGGGSSNTKSDASKKKNSKKQKKKQQQLIQKSSQQAVLTKLSSSGVTSFAADSAQKEQQILQKTSPHQLSSSSSYSNQYYGKNEQFDEWDFELPTYKQVSADPNALNKPLSLIIQDEQHPMYFNFQKNGPPHTKQNSSDKQIQLQQQQLQLDLKSKSTNLSASDQKNQSLANSVKKESSTPSQIIPTQQQPQKKNSGSGFTVLQNQQTYQAPQTVIQSQTFPQQQQKSSSLSGQVNYQQQGGQKANPFQNESGLTAGKQNKQDRNDLTARNSDDKQNDTYYEQQQKQFQLNSISDQYYLSSDQGNQQRQQAAQQEQSSMHNTISAAQADTLSQSKTISLDILYKQNTFSLYKSGKKEDITTSEQGHKEIIMNQTLMQIKPQHQSHPPGLPLPPSHSEDLTLMKQMSEQSSTSSSQVTIQQDDGSKTKIGDNPPPKQKTLNELSEKQQKMMKSIKSEPFNPNKGSISLKLDAIVLEQDFKTEELVEKQRIHADEYSETIRVMYKENQYCLKIFKNLSAHNLRKVNVYIENLRVLAAPRLIRSYGKTITCLKLSFDLMLLLDYKEKNLLESMKQKMLLSFNDKLLVFWQIVQGIQHIHGHFIQESMVHGNLKPENILLSPKKKVFLQDIYVLKNRENKYRPKNEGLTQSADIWSLGLMTYFIFTDHLIDTEKALYLISEQVLLNQIYKPGNNDIRVIYNLIEKMLDLNPSKRPDIEEIVSHLKPIIQKKNKELNTVLNVQSSAFENIPHISQQNINILSFH